MIHPAKAFLMAALFVVGLALPYNAPAAAAEIEFHLDKRFSKKRLGKAIRAEVLKEDKKFIVSVILEKPARELLAQLTNKHKGEWIYLQVGKQVLYSGVLPEPILDGEILIDGEYSRQEAEDIVTEIMGPNRQ